MRPLRRIEQQIDTRLDQHASESLARKLGIAPPRDEDNVLRLARLMRSEWRRERYRRLTDRG